MPGLDLDEDTSRHVIQVLRMQEGEKIKLTDGNGHSAVAIISAAHKKHASIKIISFDTARPRTPRLTIAISLVKNTSRFEWFLEKATELGAYEIVPMLCERTVREKYRHESMVGICKSAILQ